MLLLHLVGFFCIILPTFKIPLASIPLQENSVVPVHKFTSYFSRIHFTNILPFTLWSSDWFLPRTVFGIFPNYYYYYYYYSALELVWAGTGAQSGDRYGSGTLQPGQVLKGSLPLLSPFSECTEENDEGVRYRLAGPFRS